MKVLMVHNYYQSSSPSGEDIVFKNEVELLRKNGIDVVTFTRNNDDIDIRTNGFKAAVNVLSSREAYIGLEDLLRKEKPAIAHFHNIWYRISPSAYGACWDSKVPVVQTLHNYRFFCVNGLLMRHGRVCEDCVGTLTWRGVLRGCYKNSRLYSIPIALTQSYLEFVDTLRKQINAHIALTAFAKNFFVRCGLPEETLYIKPNFILDPPQPTGKYDNYILYLGRLSIEKGVHILIDAFIKLKSIKNDYTILNIIGDGPLKNELENQVRSKRVKGINFLGRKSPGESMEILKSAKFVVVPSMCYEMLSMTTLEAFSCGKPVIASNIGGLAEVVQEHRTGLLFEPGNAEELASKMKWLIENEDACISLGENARAEFEAKYTAERNFGILMRIYEKAMK